MAPTRFKKGFARKFKIKQKQARLASILAIYSQSSGSILTTQSNRNILPSMQSSGEKIEVSENEGNCSFSDIDEGLPKSLPSVSQDVPETSFRTNLASWAVNENISHKALRSLLNILKGNVRDIQELQTLPSDPRTLLRTPSKTENCIDMGPGCYYYFGIEANIINLCDKFDVNLDESSKFFISVNIDGVPLFKSSGESFWPILCVIKSIDSLSKEVFCIALYLGSSKPNINEYLKDFVKEVSDQCYIQKLQNSCLRYAYNIDHRDHGLLGYQWIPTNNMVWYVVKFTKENSFEVVPKAWFVELSLECFWPPLTYKTEKILKLIENCEGPGTEWKVHPAKLLGAYTDLNKAKRKAKKALATSDISSSNEEAINTRRKKRKNPKYSSSGADSDESDNNSYPILKKGFSSRSFSQDLAPRKSQPKNALKRYRSRSYSPSGPHDFTAVNLLTEKSLNETGRGEMSSQMASTSFCQTPPTNLEYEHSEPSLNMANVSIPTTSRQQKTITSRQQIESDNVAGDNDFKKMVLSELSHLHLKINAIGENVSSIVAFHKSNAGSLLPTSSLDAITSLNKRLPIKSVEELNEFETWLGEENNYKLMVTEFKRIGGQSMPQTVRRILYKAFTNSVANKYSWDGAKKKDPLKHFLLARGILDAVKFQYSQSTEAEIVDVLRVWMVKAKERLKHDKSHDENQEIVTD
ncbi:unnamed protein product [Brassicogethes aeneus]|uniref:DUF4806 domain-containing protein n=1 Tax=Brassicogethes aeneus TaxID=1431903 RepID=A0A9P0FGK8_BRAAE|nr:unnamed protein product [Brassicogethes aeneus]